MDSREYSLSLLARMGECLAGLPRRAPEVLAVAASGSLGRLEAGPDSDGDLIVVVADDLPAGEPRLAALRAVWDRLAPLGLRPPDPAGIFTRPVTPAQLTDPGTLGRVADDRAVFGQRFQLLLDARAVHGHTALADLSRAILHRYATGFIARDPRKQWVTLLNDLVRYFRSLALEAQWDFGPRDGGWYVRNLKFRFSRVALYAGLLFLLGEAGTRARPDPVDQLAKRLGLTPLERIAASYEAAGDLDFRRIAEPYAAYLAARHDPATLAALAAAPPLGPDGPWHPVPAAYERLHDLSCDFHGELVRFVLAQQARWSPRFFQYLLF